MFLHKLNLNPFYFPEEVVDKGGKGVESMIEFMGEENDDDEKIDLKEDEKKEDSKEDKKEDEEEKEDDEKEDKELDELEDELEEPDDEKLELTTPVRRKEILAKYPKLFKDFPYLEKAYYREQQFTEIVPTIEDAREAVAKADVLDKFSADIDRGDLTQALKAVKSSGEKSFNFLVDNYLPNLAKVDKDAYLHVVGNIIKFTVGNMITESKESKNEDLEAAANILNHFIFQTNKVQTPTRLSKEDDNRSNEVDEVNQERQKLFNERFETSKDELNTRISNVLKSTIKDNIDPKESMTDYVRKTAARECQEKLESLIDGDKRFGIILDKLWQQSAKENFSKLSVDKIKSAYISRAKTLLPTVIKEARNEALRGSGKRIREDEKDDTPKKGPLPTGHSASNKPSGNKSEREKSREIPRGMSTREFLMQED